MVDVILHPSKDCAAFLRRMADLMEDPESNFVDFIAFFHLDPLDETTDHCGVVPVGFVEPTGHLIDFLTRFFSERLLIFQSWRHEGVFGVIYPEKDDDGKITFRFAHYDREVDEGDVK